MKQNKAVTILFARNEELPLRLHKPNNFLFFLILISKTKKFDRSIQKVDRSCIILK